MRSLSRFTESLPLIPERRATRYGVTLALCIAALAVRWALDHDFPPGYPFVTFFPAVILSSFLFGPRPGAVAALLCGFFAWYFFMPPRMTLQLGPGTPTALLFYTGVVVVDIVLVHLMQRANARLHAAREDVRALAEERGRLVERTEVLFQELQHRVGNNLQMVGALLSLQMRKTSEPEARRALADAAARLQIIGTIQRGLYRTDGELVPLDVFLRELAGRLQAAGGREGITCEVQITPGITLRPESAVPVALIVSEAVANAMEHGFSGRERGHIEIAGSREGDSVVLTVRDNGRGLPAGFEPGAADSIGIRISLVLAQQLRAAYRLDDAAPGTIMRLDLPAPTPS